MTTLCSESYVFDGRPAYPLLVPAKRYWHPSLSHEDGLTLILAHGTGFHKEHWEPFLDDLFGLLGTAASIGGPRLRVREAWAIDAPNHGAGALLNEATLRFGYEPVCESRPPLSLRPSRAVRGPMMCGGGLTARVRFTVAWDEYALAIHRFLAGHGSGIPVDFARRRLVAVGHSFGAIALSVPLPPLLRLTPADPAQRPHPHVHPRPALRGRRPRRAHAHHGGDRHRRRLCGQLPRAERREAEGRLAQPRGRARALRSALVQRLGSARAGIARGEFPRSCESVNACARALTNKRGGCRNTACATSRR